MQSQTIQFIIYFFAIIGILSTISLIGLIILMVITPAEEEETPLLKPGKQTDDPDEDENTTIFM